MRVIVLNPWNKTISEAVHNGHYTDYYRLLSGPTADGLPDARVDCFQIVGLGDAAGHLMFVDDEGLLNLPQRYFRLSGSSTTFAGRAVVTGGDRGEDESAATLSIEQLASCVTWLPDDTEVEVPPPVVTEFDDVDELLAAIANWDRPNLLSPRG